MHHTREDAERVLAVVDAKVNSGESETPAATGAKDPDKGTAKQVQAAAPAAGGKDSNAGMTEQVDADAASAGSPKIPADAPAAGGKDSDTGTTEDIGAAPAESLEIQADTYTREVAQWLTSLTSKASGRGVFMPTMLIEMCPSPQKPASRSWSWYLGCARVTPRCFDVR